MVITLDGSALNLALPTIARGLDADSAGISWVVDAYTLPLASLLLLGGSLGDRLGAARLFRVGAVGFAGASIGCALSPSIGLLVSFRAAQGVFAALLLPMVLALVGKSFADAGERSKAVNLMTVFGGAGMAAGPFLGGLLTDTTGWRAVFWLTAPVAIAAALLVAPSASERGTPGALRFDTAGQVTGTGGLVLLVSGVIELGRGTGPVFVWPLLGLGAGLMAVFVLTERRVPHPMMPMAVFGNAAFRRAVMGGFAFQFGAYGLQFFLAVHLQRVWGVSALQGGLLLVSFAIGVVLASLTLNPILSRRGTRAMTVVGASAAALATLALLFLGAEDGWPLLVLAEFLVGAGSGIYSTALNQVAGAALGAEAAGLASGIYNTARQVGQCVGIAVFGALAALADTRLGHVIAIAIVASCAAVIAATGLRRPVPAAGGG
ncbi:MFS transporter [Nonomuraea sp. NPDC050691]|uniref:MFS transporter n=1 Tax=Nonomuraea sp. NPDC050691 TaxID=3155661 RepID=UPI0033CF6BF8